MRFFLWSCLFLCGVASSQTLREGRFFCVPTPMAGILRWKSRGKVVLVSRKSGIAPTTADSEIDCPGDFHLHHGGWADFELFLAGRGRAGGKLVSLRLDSRNRLYKHWEYPEVAGADFTGVAYSVAAGKIYLLDARGYIWWLPYRLGGSVPTGALNQLVSPWHAASLPAITRAGEYLLTVRADGPSPVLSMGVAGPYGRYPFIDLDFDRFPIRHDSQTGLPVFLPPIPGRKKTSVYFSAFAFPPGATHVSVYGPPSLSVQVYRCDVHPPTIVGMGVLNGSWACSVSTSPLRWGGVYAVKVSGSSRLSDYFTVQDKVAHPSGPDPLPNGSAFLPFANDGMIFYVGNQNFMMPLSIKPGPGQVSPVVYPAVLMVGTPDRIVVLSDGRKALNPSVFYSGSIEVQASDGASSGIVVDIPLGRDLAAGSLVSFQWAVMTSRAGFSLTEVETLYLRPASLSLWAHGSKGAVSSKGPKLPPKAKIRPDVPSRLASSGTSLKLVPSGRLCSRKGVVSTKDYLLFLGRLVKDFKADKGK